MLEAIENRTSRRTFKKEDLNENELQIIDTKIIELNKDSALSMKLLKDCGNAFSSLSKSYGLFSNVKYLILVKGSINDIYLKEKAGYYGEELVLLLTTLGLGTCWVGATFNKASIEIKDDEKMICVIALGKIQEPTIKEKLIRSLISKKRKPIEERLSSDTNDLPQWLINGMMAVQLAPSANNSQKVLFKYEDSTLSASIIGNTEFDLVDLGIAKKHFEKASNGVFKIGNGESFKLNKL